MQNWWFACSDLVRVLDLNRNWWERNACFKIRQLTVILCLHGCLMNIATVYQAPFRRSFHVSVWDLVTVYRDGCRRMALSRNCISLLGLWYFRGGKIIYSCAESVFMILCGWWIHNSEYTHQILYWHSFIWVKAACMHWGLALMYHTVSDINLI